jgi:hypothetical protein
MNADEFRTIALSMAEASEGAHMGHPISEWTERFSPPSVILMSTLAWLCLHPKSKRSFFERIRMFSLLQKAHGDGVAVPASGSRRSTRLRSAKPLLQPGRDERQKRLIEL